MTTRVVDHAVQRHAGGDVRQEFGLASPWTHSGLFGSPTARGGRLGAGTREGQRGRWSQQAGATESSTATEESWRGCGTEGSSQQKGGRLKEIAMAFRHVVAVAGTLIVGLACSAGAQSGKPGPDEMVNSPPFANWAQFKPGTTVTQKEIVSTPDGRKLEQTITH